MFILFCLPGTDAGPKILCLCILMWNLIVDFSKANLISSTAPYNTRDRHSIHPKRTTSVHSIASPLWKYRNSFERPRLVVRGGLVGDLNERLLILSDARSHVRARTHSHVPAIRRSILWFNQSNETRVHFGTGDPLLCSCHNWKQYQRRAWHPVSGDQELGWLADPEEK